MIRALAAGIARRGARKHPSAREIAILPRIRDITVTEGIVLATVPTHAAGRYAANPDDMEGAATGRS